MSVLLQQYESVSDSAAHPNNIQISEGDWTAYMLEITNCRREILTRQALDDVISFKRSCALAYLGRRAQKHGGVCSRSQPRIFSAEAIAGLSENNAKTRFQRYPWLEKLLKLMADIETIQDEISVQGNVISLTNTGPFPGPGARNAMTNGVVRTPLFSFDSPARA